MDPYSGAILTKQASAAVCLPSSVLSTYADESDQERQVDLQTTASLALNLINLAQPKLNTALYDCILYLPQDLWSRHVIRPCTSLGTCISDPIYQGNLGQGPIDLAQLGTLNAILARSEYKLCHANINA